MKIYHEILENGDLKIVSQLEEKESRIKWKKNFEKDFKNTHQKAIDQFHEIFFGNTGFRFEDDEEKYRLGDLTDGDILTDLPDLDLGDTKEWDDITAEKWNSNSWYFPNYMTTSWIEELFTKGQIIFKMRGNN